MFIGELTDPEWIQDQAKVNVGQPVRSFTTKDTSMRILKIFVSVTLVATVYGHAPASADPGQTMERCRMDFPVRWVAWQFIPCWAARVWM
jgi:hypothetical protein